MSILEILEAHKVRRRPWSMEEKLTCMCREVFIAETERQLRNLHRAHVAQVLEQHEREAIAVAWEEGFFDGRRQDAEGDDGPRFVNPYKEQS